MTWRNNSRCEGDERLGKTVAGPSNKQFDQNKGYGENSSWSNRSGKKNGSFENEALKTRKRSTQNSKPKHAKIENEAPKTRKRSTQNSKPVCPLKTRDSPLSSHQC